MAALRRRSIRRLSAATIGVLLWAPVTPGPLSRAAQARSPSPAVTTLAGTTVAFSGYSWAVKSSTALVGPGPNVFSSSPENVWVDAAGQLHLRITFRNGRWQSAEVFLDRSLGYGTYRFAVASAVGNLDPNAVLGLFTWDDDPSFNHRELDVEFARWGNAGGATNAQYVVQPYDRVGHLTRFVQPLSAPSVHSFTWGPRSVNFTGTDATGRTIASSQHTGADVPRPGGERTHINLWLDRGAPPTNGAEIEVVLSSFSFSP